MSKKPSRPQASSSRAYSQGFSSFGSSGFSNNNAGFETASSSLSHLAEQPDLSSLQDANIVVQYKNLAKKDSTTKAKALEELQNIIVSFKESEKEIDESFLSAWVKVYPRASIDNSRRVRHLAHLLHGQICLLSGKRVAKYMPSVIGPWFAGSHDPDRIVARTAAEAFSIVFPTEEKRSTLSKVYQASILEFGNDAILKETAQTLSDERVTTTEDAEAVYFRVVSSNVLSICSLIENLQESEVSKQTQIYQELLSSDKLWKFQGSKDPTVRRSIFQLLRSCLRLQKALDLLTSSLDTICRNLFSEVVMKRQGATALSYAVALLEMSSFYPEMWTKNSQKSVDRVEKFSSFLKLGSQGGSEAYWRTIGEILLQIPGEALPHQFESAKGMLLALRDGINSRDEPRSNAEQAWISYVRLFDRFSSMFGAEDKEKLGKDCAMPIVQQYINPTAEGAYWTVQGPQAGLIIGKLLEFPHVLLVAEAEWPSLAQILLDKMKTSAPEQARDYKSSQDSVSAMAKKWFSLQAQILKGPLAASFKEVALEHADTLARECANILKLRVGKPYGVAEALNSAVKNLEIFFRRDSSFSQKMEEFISVDVPELISSSSRSHLVTLLYEYQHSPRFFEAWNATLDAILESANLEERNSLLELLLKSPHVPDNFDLAIKNSRLQSFLCHEADRAIDGNGDWNLLASLIHTPINAISTGTMDYMLSEILKSVTIDSKASQSLSGLEIITQRNQQQANRLLQSEMGSELRQKILLLTESEDDALAKRATAVNDQVGSAFFEGINGENSKQYTIQIIHNGLSEADSSSLSIETLVELALQHLRSSGNQSDSSLLDLFPNMAIWAHQLEILLNQPLPPSMAASIELGSIIPLLDDSRTKQQDTSPQTFDKSGYSPSLRMFAYTVAIIEQTELITKMSEERFAEIFRLLLLSRQAINDKLTVEFANEMWHFQDVLMEENMVDLVSRTTQIIDTWLRQTNGQSLYVNPGSPETPLQILQFRLLSHLSKLSWLSFHDARVYSHVVTQLIEMKGFKPNPENFLENRLKELRQSQDILPLAVFVSAFKAPLTNIKYFERVCNELIANLTGAKLVATPVYIYEQFALLGLMLDEEEQITNSIAKQRLIFFVQHVSSWLIDDQADESLKTQICVVLRILLPEIKDIYGAHWSHIMAFLSQVWIHTTRSNESDLALGASLPLYNASLRLYALLNSLARDEDANDDLREELQDSSEAVLKGLLDLLKGLSTIPDAFNQPLQIVNELLGRQIERMPSKKVSDFEELYPLVAAESLAAQRCAFEIIHKQIAERQEQVSVDLALEKSDARLPDELLSLVIEGPSVETLSDSDFLRTMPLPVRSYLSAWILIFDHFKGSSEKVRMDYMAHMKEGGFLSKLLDFTFDFLGHSQGKPIDASKFDATVYSFDIEESPVRDVQWLLTHLYYLSLKRVSTLVKTWLADCKSRQTVISVEPWTEKNMSPSLITDALAGVDEWAKTQDSRSDEAVQIKTNPRAKEVVVSKEVDDQLMSMVIRLPNNFPLGQVQLHGINRIAVDEKKWQTFLRNSQGVITFSNNSIVDGIIAFRRNVVGALKGQTECAICYAIVGSDKQLPTKKCATCNNLFHGSCLFRWFNTSGATTCPLCRNPFNYTERRSQGT